MRAIGHKNNKGVVLILTLAVIAILAVFIIEFNYSSRVDLDIAHNIKEGLKAEYLAKSAINMAVLLLKKDEDFSVDSLGEEWAQDFPVVALEQGEASFKIVDEEGKININKISGDNQAQAQLKRLLVLLGEQDGIIEEEWNDLPYETIGQFSKGKYNRLEKYITVYGQGKININTAPLEVIEALSKLMDRQTAERIVEFRKDNPFSDISELSPAYEYDKPKGIGAELYNDIKNYIVVRSEFFTIIGKAKFKEGTYKQIQAVVQRNGKDCKIVYYE